jgi:hypothetical protein
MTAPVGMKPPNPNDGSFEFLEDFVLALDQETILVCR